MHDIRDVQLPKELKAVCVEHQNYYELFKKEVTANALKVLQETIPMKMKEFDTIMPISSSVMAYFNSDTFPCDDPIYNIASNYPSCGNDDSVGNSAKKVKIDSSTKVLGKINKTIYTEETKTSPSITEKIEHIKNEATDLLKIVAIVKLWIQLNIPKIEDGNNFGVAIQEDIIHELSRVEEAAFNLRENTSKYYLQRAKLMTKIIKYPNVEDYRMALKELDERQWFQMKITDMDTRNNYVIIYDMLHKNWHKVVRPRGTVDSSMLVY